MKTRKLITGKRVKELEAPVKWEFESKCPEKWVHIDCENGHIYTADWLQPGKKLVEAAIKALQNLKAQI